MPSQAPAPTSTKTTTYSPSVVASTSVTVEPDIICLLYFPERENPSKTSFFRLYYDKHQYADRNKEESSNKPIDSFRNDILEQVVLMPGPNFCSRELWEWLKSHPQLESAISIRASWGAIIERKPTEIKSDIPATNTTVDYDQRTALELISVCCDEAWLKSCLPFEKRIDLLGAINARIAKLQQGEVR